MTQKVRGSDGFLSIHLKILEDSCFQNETNVLIQKNVLYNAQMVIGMIAVPNRIDDNTSA